MKMARVIGWSVWEHLVDLPEEQLLLSAAAERRIQEGLRAMYADLLAQPLPDHLIELARALENRLQDGSRAS